jgi:hypothetical protein
LRAVAAGRAVPIATPQPLRTSAPVEPSSVKQEDVPAV